MILIQIRPSAPGSPSCLESWCGAGATTRHHHEKQPISEGGSALGSPLPLLSRETSDCPLVRRFPIDREQRCRIGWRYEDVQTAQRQQREGTQPTQLRDRYLLQNSALDCTQQGADWSCTVARLDLRIFRRQETGQRVGGVPSTR